MNRETPLLLPVDLRDWVPGIFALDGMHAKANASKHKSVRYDRAGELEQVLLKDIAELLQKAERSDHGAGSASSGSSTPMRSLMRNPDFRRLP